MDTRPATAVLGPLSPEQQEEDLSDFLYKLPLEALDSLEALLVLKLNLLENNSDESEPIKAS